jgi:hypothetical protein
LKHAWRRTSCQQKEQGGVPKPNETIGITLLDSAKSTVWAGQVTIPVCDPLMRLHLIAGQIIRQNGRERLAELDRVTEVGWLLPGRNQFEWLDGQKRAVLTRLWHRIVNDSNGLNWWRDVD